MADFAGLLNNPMTHIGLGLLGQSPSRHPDRVGIGPGIQQGLLSYNAQQENMLKQQQLEQEAAYRQAQTELARSNYGLNKQKFDQDKAVYQRQQAMIERLKQDPTITAEELFALEQGGTAAAQVIQNRIAQPGMLEGTSAWVQQINGIVNSYPPEMRDQVRLDLLRQSATQPTHETRPDGSIVERPGLRLPVNPLAPSGMSQGSVPSPGMSPGIPTAIPGSTRIHEKPLGADAANFRDRQGKIPDARMSVREATELGFQPLTESERKGEEKLQVLGVKAKEGTQVINQFKEKLDKYEKAFSESGTEYWPGAKKAKLESALTDLQLELKNLAELGVLAGEDLTLIEKLTGTPTSIGSNILGMAGLDATDQKIESMKEMLNSTYRALLKKSAGVPESGAIFTGEPYKIGGSVDPSTGRPSKNLKFNPQTGKLE